MDEADRFLAEAAKSEGLDYPSYQRKYGFGRNPHQESPVSGFGDSQSPATPVSGVVPPEEDPFEAQKATSELSFYRDLGVSERTTGTLVRGKRQIRA